MSTSHLDKLDVRAEFGDVSYGLCFYLYRFADPATKPRAKQILKKGRRAEALRWLRSASKEGMRSGTSTKKERLYKAKVFAELAGTTIEELAKETDLEHLLTE